MNNNIVTMDGNEAAAHIAYNFTEIAAELSFGSSQYFTAVFRRVTGMTPSEYRESVLK